MLPIHAYLGEVNEFSPRCSRPLDLRDACRIFPRMTTDDVAVPSVAIRPVSQFAVRTQPPRTVTDTFGQMLLNVHGMSTAKIENVLRRYPTPRVLVEALDEHCEACSDAGARVEAGWLLAEVLEPGCRRRALSERITAFFTQLAYAEAGDALGSQPSISSWPRCS